MSHEAQIVAQLDAALANVRRDVGVAVRHLHSPGESFSILSARKLAR